MARLDSSGRANTVNTLALKNGGANQIFRQNATTIEPAPYTSPSTNVRAARARYEQLVTEAVAQGELRIGTDAQARLRCNRCV
jgi:hypothetical protein